MSLRAQLMLLAVALPAAALTESERAQIDRITGARGVYSAEEDTQKVSFPRTGVNVTVDGWAMHPFQGLTSWAAFRSGSHGAIVMGDLTLFEDEVNPVLQVALNQRLEVTALHNHFFYDTPRVMFMHISGEGPLQDLAQSVRLCLDKVKDIRSRAPVPAQSFRASPPPAAGAITAAPLDSALGVKGQTSNGMYKATIGRHAIAHGRTVGAQMGVNTWAAFAGGDADAFVDGDFAMLTGELQDVLKMLTKGGIQIVAIHNHMVHEEPQYVFLHYWGRGRALDLARVLRSALDTQKNTWHLGHPAH